MITLETNEDLINFIKSHRLNSKEVNQIFKQLQLSAFFVNETDDSEYIAGIVEKHFKGEINSIFLDI
jgi:hypothetical protein